jgi:hypothetical protein
MPATFIPASVQVAVRVALRGKLVAVLVSIYVTWATAGAEPLAVPMSNVPEPVVVEVPPDCVPVAVTPASCPEK